MPNQAIIHTATRVVLGLTTEDTPVLAPGQSTVVVPANFNLAGGPWKLALDGTKVAPTDQEIDDSDIDDARVQARRIAFLARYDDALAAIEAASTQAQMMTALKDWAALHRKLTKNITR